MKRVLVNKPPYWTFMLRTQRSPKESWSFVVIMWRRAMNGCSWNGTELNWCKSYAYIERNTDGWFGTSDPLLRFYKIREDRTIQKVHETEVVMNNLNPVWVPFEISAGKLCQGADNQAFKSYIIHIILSEWSVWIGRRMANTSSLVKPQWQWHSWRVARRISSWPTHRRRIQACWGSINFRSSWNQTS